jgi:hypothetical protein
MIIAMRETREEKRLTHPLPPTGLAGSVLQVLVDPDQPPTIYAVWNELAENRNVLVKSTDGGENWSRNGR